MTSSSNTVASSNIISNLTAELDKLCDERKDWEANAYKRSNDQLYAILARCLDIYVLLRDDVKQRRVFRSKLDNLTGDDKVVFNEGTNLPTRIVRYVFRNNGKRSFAYAKVLIAAHEANVDSVRLASWIVENGGVEQVRRKQNDVTPSMREANFRAIASAKLAKQSAIGGSICAIDRLQPSVDAEHEFSLALLRKEADGTMSVVDGTNNSALVNKFLALVGKQLNDEQAQAKKSDAVRADNAARDAIISKAA